MLQKLVIRCSLIMLVFVLQGGTAYAAPPQGYAFLPLTEAAQRASDEGKPMLLYFGRYGCSTCRRMHAEVFTDAAVGERYKDGFILAYVDTESGNRIRLGNGETITEMQFASRNRILGTPTFIFFSAEQKPLFKKAGFQTVTQMKLYGDYVLAGHYQSMQLPEFMAQQ